MDVLLEIFLGGVVSGLSYLASRNLASSCKFFDAFGVSFALSFSEVDVFFWVRFVLEFILKTVLWTLSTPHRVDVLKHVLKIVKECGVSIG